MKKQVAIISTLIVVIIVLGIFIFSKLSNSQSDSKVKDSNNKNATSSSEKIIKSNSKILVVYFSAQSHTKAVAEKISENLKADLFEIVPKDEYTEEDLDYTDDNSRVVNEYNNGKLRNTELEDTTVDNWESYDVVLIGYPIWWSIAAWPTNSFVKANDFSNKIVIPFCTSASSYLGQSAELLEEDTKTGEWHEGKRFSSNPSESEIKDWTDGLHE